MPTPSTPCSGALGLIDVIGPPSHGRQWWLPGRPRAGHVSVPGGRLDLLLTASLSGPGSAPWPAPPGAPSAIHVGACMPRRRTISLIFL